MLRRDFISKMHQVIERTESHSYHGGYTCNAIDIYFSDIQTDIFTPARNLYADMFNLEDYLFSNGMPCYLPEDIKQRRLLALTIFMHLTLTDKTYKGL